jgi:hypothetical protein
MGFTAGAPNPIRSLIGRAVPSLQRPNPERWHANLRPELRQIKRGEVLRFDPSADSSQLDLEQSRIGAPAAAAAITLLAFELRHAILQHSCGQVIPWQG